MAPTPTSSPARFVVSILGRVAVALGHLGVTPNGLTYASLVPAIASGFAAAAGAFLLAAGLLLLSGLCDALDGQLARATNQATAYGALLDSTLDRLSDAAPLLGLTVYFAPGGWLVAVPGITLLGAYTISYVRARAEALDANLPPLWMRRTDRIVILGIALLLGDVHLPGIAVSAPLTLLVVGIAGLLNILASMTALAAARILFRSQTRRAP